MVRLIKPDVYSLLIEGKAADRMRLERIIGHLIDSYGNNESRIILFKLLKIY